MNMKVEVSRFVDGRLKVLTKHRKSDTNIRIEADEVSICPRFEELALEKDVLEAVDLWNRMPRDPAIRSVVIKKIDGLIEQSSEFRALAKASGHFEY